MREAVALPVYPSDADAEEPVVSPPREVRSTDVSRLRAQAGTIIAIVIAAVSIVLYVERGFSDIKSEIRQLNTLRIVDKENIELKLQLMKSDLEKAELRKALLDNLTPKR
jgi:hypothetical protein